MDSKEIYTQILPAEEVAELIKQYPNLYTTPVIDPRLLQFAFIARTEQTVKGAIQNYMEWLRRCPCWHCDVMRERANTIGLTGYDCWLRVLLLCNGMLHYQLN